MTLSGHNLHIIICRLLVEYTASEILTLLSKEERYSALYCLLQLYRKCPPLD